MQHPEPTETNDSRRLCRNLHNIINREFLISEKSE